jgi:hypothetical protein
VQTNTVGRDFFTTMGIPIVRGRGFNASDTATSPKVAIVNRALAKQFFPGQDALGKMFESDPEDIEGPVEIIGICPDTRYADLRSQTPPTFYIDYRQNSGAGRMVFEIQTAGEPTSVLNAARAVVASMEHDLPLTDVRTMLLALVLASVGIYGIMAYSVASRTSEIGIRLALGAQPANVRRMILRESGWLAVVGAVAGVAAALVLSRLVKSMLYGVEPYDLLSLVVGVAVLLVVALAASWIPARRAARLQPMEALRHE